MERVSWKHSKAYHIISFLFSPEGRFLILEWKTGSRETWRKPCGRHRERAGSGWAPHLALLPGPPPPAAPALQPTLLVPLLWSDEEGFVLLWFRNTQTKALSVTLGHVLEDLPTVSARCGKPSPPHIWVMVAFSYPWQERNQSYVAIVPSSSSETWPVQTAISSRPHFHLSPHTSSARGDSSPSTRPRVPGLAAFVTHSGLHLSSHAGLGLVCSTTQGLQVFTFVSGSGDYAQTPRYSHPSCSS